MRALLHRRHARSGARGVTLVELVVVISLVAIISAVAMVAVREPMLAYADTARRAEMADQADTALRRIARELRGALPNSIRLNSGATSYLEFFPVKTAGRYRSDSTGAAAADPLSFSFADTKFNIIGAPSTEPGQTMALGDILVVRNDSSLAGDVRSNAYTFNQSGAGFDCTSPTGANCNTTTISGALPPAAAGIPDEYVLNFAAREFNKDTTSNRGFGSPGSRFYVVTPPVTYVCAPSNVLDANGDSPGTLRRVTGYAIQLAQPTPAGGDLVANNVSACAISYSANVSGYTGLVVLRLSITRGSETVSLYQEVHVNNAP